MNWKVVFSDGATKQFRKLDKRAQTQIAEYVRERLGKAKNPRFSGKALKGKLRGYWRYRTGNYRLICDIQDGQFIILVIEIGDRKDIYD